MIMKKRRKLLLIIATAVIAVAAITVLCCPFTVGRSYGPTHGVLLDASGGQPIAGAAVVAVYCVDHFTVGGSVAEPVDAQETITDAEGRFVLPAKRVSAPRRTAAFQSRPRIHIFASGYESVALLRDQAYSRIDAKKIPLGDGSSDSYRIDARPMVSVLSTPQGQVYQFRVSPLETKEARSYNANTDFVDGPAAKFPYYLKLFNAERTRYGLPEWAGWESNW